jgi:phospholipid transport system substrate-binding protein
MKTQFWLTIMAWLVLGFLAAPALAESPTDYVRGILDRAMAIQNDPALAGPAHEPARARAIHQIIEQSFDFPLMARESLGPTYSRLSPGQRAEFTRIFSYLFQDSYTRLVLNFLKKETVIYNRQNQKNQEARVDTTMVRPNETIPVDYLMHRHQQRWILYDVKVDGVSILNNYKQQFARVIATRSFEVLMEKMRKQYQAIK